MAFSPNLFYANIKAKDGLARPNRFQVILPIPPYVGRFVSSNILENLLNFPNTIATEITNIISGGSSTLNSSNPSLTRYLSLQCDSTELPGRTIATDDVKIYGPTFKVPVKSEFGSGGVIPLNFICTNDFYERKLFDRWLDAIQPSDTNNFRFAKNEDSSYMSTIRIIQYDDFIKEVYSVDIIDAFPVGIASQPLSWGDDGFHRLSVSFAFQKYKPIYKGSYDLVDAAATIFGTQAAQRLFRSTLA